MLEFRGRKRQVMTLGHYTELFFLDEATALAASHRPCAECRHARFLDFCSAWGPAHPQGGRSARPTAQEIDDRLHAERVSPDRTKHTFEAALDSLPDGVFVAVPTGERKRTWCGAMRFWPGRPEDTVNDGGDRRARRFGC